MFENDSVDVQYISDYLKQKLLKVFLIINN